MAQPALHPIIRELCRWAFEMGLHDCGYSEEELAAKHHEIKMRYYEKTTKGKVPK